MTSEPPPTAAPAPPPARKPLLVTWLLVGASRLVMLIGIGSLLAAATTLLVFGGFATYNQIAELWPPGSRETTSREVFLASIKLIDLVLLATVLEVIAISLYSLFIDDNIAVPRWLRSEDVDSLKSKLAGIIAVMLGVLFLEQVITGAPPGELLLMGLGLGAVILALSYFIRSH
ncbi:MAG: YqhA family protein [Geminicoccaceae bacterium]